VADFTAPPMFLLIEASSNLVNWFGIYTNRSPATFQTFVDFEAGSDIQRFYRAVGRDPLFRFGLVARGQINFNGDNIYIDSFDSSDPSASTDGRYDVAKARDHGDVATDSQSVNAGNSKVYGRVATGPGGMV